MSKNNFVKTTAQLSRLYKDSKLRTNALRAQELGIYKNAFSSGRWSSQIRSGKL